MQPTSHLADRHVLPRKEWLGRGLDENLKNVGRKSAQLGASTTLHLPNPIRIGEQRAADRDQIEFAALHEISQVIQIARCCLSAHPAPSRT